MASVPSSKPSTRMQRAYRLNSVEQERLRSRMHFLEQAKIRSGRVANYDIRAMASSIETIRLSSGHKSKEPAKSKQPPPLTHFWYGERIGSRRFGKFRRGTQSAPPMSARAHRDVISDPISTPVSNDNSIQASDYSKEIPEIPETEILPLSIVAKTEPNDSVELIGEEWSFLAAVPKTDFPDFTFTSKFRLDKRDLGGFSNAGQGCVKDALHVYEDPEQLKFRSLTCMKSRPSTTPVITVRRALTPSSLVTQQQQQQS